MYNILIMIMSLVIGGINYKMYSYIHTSNFALLVYYFGLYILLGMFIILSYGCYMKFKSNRLTKSNMPHSKKMDKIYKMDKRFEVICIVFIISSTILVLIGILEEVIKRK